MSIATGKRYSLGGDHRGERSEWSTVHSLFWDIATRAFSARRQTNAACKQSSKADRKCAWAKRENASKTTSRFKTSGGVSSDGNNEKAFKLNAKFYSIGNKGKQVLKRRDMKLDVRKRNDIDTWREDTNIEEGFIVSKKKKWPRKCIGLCKVEPMEIQERERENLVDLQSKTGKKFQEKMSECIRNINYRNEISGWLIVSNSKTKLPNLNK